MKVYIKKIFQVNPAIHNAQCRAHSLVTRYPRNSAPS